jgi:hypothetical protein
VNYSLLIMETAGMMKMASGDAFPPPAGYRKWAIDAIVEVQRLAAVKTLIWGSLRGCLNIWGCLAVDAGEEGRGGGQEDRGRAWAPWHALVGGAHHGPPLRYFFVPLVVFWPRKNRQKVSFHLENFDFLHKNNTAAVLLKTASVRVSSNQIIPKPYRIVINMA